MRSSHILKLNIFSLVFGTCFIAFGAQFGESVQYFPQLVIGKGASTTFAVHNTLGNPISVEIEIYNDEGNLVQTGKLEIDSLGTRSWQTADTVQQLTVGWAKLTSTGKFEATEFFKLTVNNQELPRVGVLPSTAVRKGKLFCFVKGSTNTGVAIANPSPDKKAGITAKLLDPKGVQVSTAQFELDPLEHVARYLTEAPYFPSLTDFEGMVEITSTQPIVLMTIRSDNDLLSSVAALFPRDSGTLVQGSVLNEHLSEGAVTGDKIAEGTVVRSLNGLTDHVILQAGDNVNVSSSNNTVTISSTAQGTGGGDITSVVASDGLTGGGEAGAVELSVAISGITTSKIAGNAVTNEKIADNSIGSGKIVDGGVGPQDLAEGAVTQTKLAAGTPASGQVLTWNGADLQWKENVLKGYVIVVGPSTVFDPRTVGSLLYLEVDCPPGTRVIGGGPYTHISSLPVPIISTDTFPSTDGKSLKVKLTAVTATGGFIAYQVRAICAATE